MQTLTASSQLFEDETPDSNEELKRKIEDLSAACLGKKHLIIVEFRGKTVLLSKILDALEDRVPSSIMLVGVLANIVKSEERVAFTRVESVTSCASHERFSRRNKGDERQMDKLEKLARKQENKQRRRR